MTESLLQQAREFRQCVNAPSPHKLAEFLDAVIEHLEISCPNLARLGTLAPTGQLERTHTLAIMAATIYSSDRSSGNPEYETVEERIVWAAERAQNLLAEVENRNP